MSELTVLFEHLKETSLSIDRSMLIEESECVMSFAGMVAIRVFLSVGIVGFLSFEGLLATSLWVVRCLNQRREVETSDNHFDLILL